jgi:hypothetical protein
MNQVIEVFVSPQGQTRIETIGFNGSTCRDASRFIERALGKIVSEQLTGEFYRQTEDQSLRQKQ